MLSKLNVRGTFKNVCEDSLYVKEFEDRISGVISDGCSTGINSVFASKLFCYLVENLIKIDLPVTDSFAVAYIQGHTEQIQEQLILTNMNFLATLILFDYDKIEKSLLVRVIGDGVIFINGNKMTYDQNNIPDYLGHHLGERIESYLPKTKVDRYDNVENFSVCSDGIDSFELSQFIEGVDINLPDKLVERPQSENYLERQFNILTKKGFKLRDDLSIITYFSDDNKV